jgi:hypothetical protein
MHPASGTPVIMSLRDPARRLMTTRPMPRRLLSHVGTAHIPRTRILTLIVTVRS